MSKYLMRVTVTIDGEDESNFNGFEEGERVLAKEVKCMNKTGSGDLFVRENFTLDYVVPATNARDWSGLSQSTVNVEFDDGSAILYRKVSVLSIGSGKASGEDEIVKTISFTAEERKDI